MNKNLKTALISSFFLLIVSMFFLPDYAEARRGRGFGGSRRSSRSFKSKKTPSRSKSSAKKSTARKNPTSFGGKRLSSSKDYTSKHGTPRKSTPKTVTKADGTKQNYVMHGYGGYGSGLMTGYMMGAVPFMWSTPFHGAYYYSRPYYVTNPDGTIGVYPPTFSMGKLFITLIIAGVIIFIIYAIIKNIRKKKKSGGASSFG